MRKIILTAIAALAASASTSAFAAGSAAVNISSTLAKSCTITTPGTVVTLTGTDASTTTTTVTCNFTGTPQLSYTSLNKGALSGETGADAGKLDYYINFGGTSVSSTNLLASAANGGAGATFPGASGAANAPVTSDLALGFKTAPSIAGTYTDTLTITVAP